MPVVSPDDYEVLRDPRVTLPICGHLVDQTTQQIIRYDPDKVAPSLQNTILSYIGDTPRDKDGFKKWLVACASRQVGKSVLTALALLNTAMYSPDTYSAIIADNKDRANDLFRAITNAYHYWPEEARVAKSNRDEVRQMTFEHRAKIVTLSAQGANPGIGRAFDYLHGSELPFWPDAAGVWNGMLPAIINRKEAAVVLESTPAPIDYPSAEWYRDICEAARKGEGRFLFSFTPFFHSRLCERTWEPEWSLSDEEERLLARFGGDNPDTTDFLPVLTKRNLAFRRSIMDMDVEVRRHPELFKVFYPVDPYSCWVQPAGAAIPSAHLDRHWQGILVPWEAGCVYKEYKEPRPGAIYVLGADPAGWMGGDQASFQIFEVWEDRWEQAAVYASNQVDPPRFAHLIIQACKRYNDAIPVVESNGVGLGTLTPLILALEDGSLKNLYFHDNYKPGIPASPKTINTGIGYLLDALIDKIVIHDYETLSQLSTYRHDKRTERSETAQLLRPEQVGTGRRAKHHWDRVSALIWACWAARQAPVRYRPELEQARQEASRDASTFEGAALAKMPYSDYKEYTTKVLADAQRRSRRSR